MRSQTLGCSCRRGGPGGIAGREAIGSGRPARAAGRQQSFPRPKVCGACLNGQALAILDSVGLGDLPESLGGIAVNQFDVRSSGPWRSIALARGICRLANPIRRGAGRAGDRRRGQFSSRNDGDTRRLREWASDEECRNVLRHSRLARQCQVRARVVLAADGLGHGSLREHTDFSSQVMRQARIGLGGHVADYPADYGPGTISMAVGRQGTWAWCAWKRDCSTSPRRWHAGFRERCRWRGRRRWLRSSTRPVFRQSPRCPRRTGMARSPSRGRRAHCRPARAVAGGRRRLRRALHWRRDGLGLCRPRSRLRGFVARGLSAWDEEIERDWQKALAAARAAAAVLVPMAGPGNATSRPCGLCWGRFVFSVFARPIIAALIDATKRYARTFSASAQRGHALGNVNLKRSGSPHRSTGDAWRSIRRILRTASL